MPRSLAIAGALALLCAAMASPTHTRNMTTDSHIHVDAARVLNRLTPLMYGSCIEDVNHEIYGGLYAQMLFGESFEEPAAQAPVAGWASYGGEWTARDGEVAVKADAGAKMLREEPLVTDVTVECDVRLADASGGNAGLVVQVSEPRTGPDAWNGYEVSISASGASGGYVRLGRHRDDWQPLRDVPARIEPGMWHRLRVVMAGGAVRVYLDGAAEPVIAYDGAPRLTGRVGLRTWYADASFRNLTIEPAQGVKVDGFTPLRGHDKLGAISRMWDAVCTGTARARLDLDREGAYNGAQCQRIEMLGGEGTVGVANRGLNRWGLTVREGRRCEGRVYLRGRGYAGKVTVALQSADGTRTYAVQQVGPVGADWQRCGFALTPNATDADARFALWIDRPGVVWVDQACLSPTGADLFHGLPMRADIGHMLQAEGLTMLRYGGSMVNAPEYRWKKMVGDRDRRPPYAGFWYPHSTNGFGIEDFVQFCRAAGFEPVFAINVEETPQDAADLVDYLNGPVTTPWGRRRAENGHPEPYGVRYIQIGNEETTNAHYIERFRLLYDAMRPRDAGVQYIIAAWWEPDNPVSRRIVQELDGKAALWDVHVGGDGLRDGDQVDALFTRMRALVQEWAPGTSLKAAVLEENGGRHDLQRALGHARILNATERHGDFVLMDCPANCLQPWKQNDNGWDQGQVFFTSGQVWGMPPYYAQQMAAANHLPLRVAGEAESPAGDLDVTATRSEDGRTLVLKVVNSGAADHRAEIDLAGFGPAAGDADAWTLTGDLADINTPEAPDRVRSRHSTVSAAERFDYTFPAHSYTVLRVRS